MRYLFLLLVGCGATQVTASEVVTTVCADAADLVADRYEAGELGQQEARDQLGGARFICTAIHDRIEESAE